MGTRTLTYLLLSLERQRDLSSSPWVTQPLSPAPAFGVRCGSIEWQREHDGCNCTPFTHLDQQLANCSYA